MPVTLLITGAAGFVGSRVLAAAAATPGTDVRAVLHDRTPPPAHGGGGPVRTVRADLAVPRSLRGLCDGVDAVLHCASLIDGDTPSLTAVNTRGTEALLAEAERAGVRRFVQLGTAAVHGRGPFVRAPAGTAPLAPLSATSRTRAAGERRVLAAGGTVLRPHLVHGPGDRWVVPGLAALLTALGARLTGHRSRLSLIDVDALAGALLAAALAPHTPPGAHAVNHPEPVPGQVLVDAVADGLRLPLEGEAGPQEARARLAGDARGLRLLEMVTTDHWFASEDVWPALRLAPPPPFSASFPRHLPWYREAARRRTRPAAPEGSADRSR